MQHRNEFTEAEFKTTEYEYGRDGETDGIGDDQKGPIEDRKELIEDLFEKAEAYIRTNVELIKIKAIDRVAEVIASILSRLILIMLFSLFFLMVNVGLALWLGDLLGRNYYGFFIVAGLYGILGIVMYLLRDPVIKHPVVNSIFTQTLKKKNHEPPKTH